MSNQTTWIVVANGSLAKIYRLVGFPKIEELTCLEHPESRMLDQDLVSSRPGRTFDSGGSRRSAYEPPSDPKQLEIDKFARELSSHLAKAHQSGDYKRLYLMASPTFLGMLRQHLDRPTQDAIVAEVAKDMTEHNKAEIEQHLAQL